MATERTDVGRGREIEEGGVYIARGSWRRWFFFRVLKITEDAVHLRLYTREFWRRPKLSDFDRDDWQLGHFPLAPDSLMQWAFEAVGVVPVEDSELEGYRIWMEDQQGGVFR